MSERWQREVQKLRNVEPGREVWHDARTRKPNGDDGLPPTRQRLVAGVVALGVFGGAAVLVWQAFGSSEQTGPVRQSSGGMVQSGGTYRLFDLSVVFPLGQSAESSHANVSYSYEWTTESFPGEAECKFTLFDDAGKVVERYPTGMVGVSPTSSRPLSITIPIQNGTPTSVEGTCGPGVVYEGPWNVSNVRFEDVPTVGDLAVIGDLALVGSDSEGMAACALRWLDSSGTEHITAGDMGIVGSSRNRVFFRMPDDAAPGVVPQVRCESYQSPDQLTEAHWLPWPETPSASSPEPDVVAVICRDGATVLADAEVGAQPDGVHVRMDADFDEPVVTFFYEDGGRSAHGLGPDFQGRSDTFVLPIPPGDVTVECGAGEVDAPSGNAVSLHVVDPAQVWQDESLACGADIVEWNPSDPPFYYTDDKPFPDAVFGTLPGLRPDDEVRFAGYPKDPNGQTPVVVRNGEVIGLFDLSTDGPKTFLINGIFCATSGLGETSGG